MTWTSSAGKPAALNWSATYCAISGTLWRPITVGMLMTCSNIACVASRWAPGSARAGGAVRQREGERENGQANSGEQAAAQDPQTHERSPPDELRRRYAAPWPSVTLRQDIRRSHFLEPADGALELEAAVARG
jgi:hypothetical protein